MKRVTFLRGGLASVAVLGMGLAVMGAAPSLQHRVDALSGPGAALAASLPASAVNLGIAAGAVAGGLALDAAGVRSVALAGASLGGLAVVAALATARLRPPRRATAAPASPPSFSEHR